MFKHGKAAVAMLGGVRVSDYLNALDLGLDADTADTTVYGSTWKSSVLGTASGKVNYGGLYDPASADFPTLLLSMVPGVLTYCPGGGAAIGDRARLVQVLSTAYAESSPVGGIVAISGSFEATGSIGFGDVLHPYGEDTNTTTGATKDDAAATATGWTAHLHVAVVDGGSWVVTIGDSANGTDWAGVGAFTAATGPTSQRLQSAAATTDLRRYVRYDATRTGGSAGDGITFFLAYARSY